MNKKWNYLSTSNCLSVGEDLARTWRLGTTLSICSMVNRRNSEPSKTIPPFVKIPQFLAIFLAVTMSDFYFIWWVFYS